MFNDNAISDPIPFQGREALCHRVPVTLQVIGPERVNAINARDLHSFLEVEKDFSDWIKVQIDRAHLVQHRDYEILLPFSGESDIHQGRGGDRRSIEYALTLSAAKKIGMMARTEKGDEVREYFLDCERIANDPRHRYMNMSRSEMLLELAAEAKAREELAQRTRQQQAKIIEMQPKAAFHDAVAEAKDGQSIGAVAKVLGTGQNRLFRLLYEHNVLMPANRLPYQEFIDQGYFRVIDQTPRTDSDGRKHIPTKTLVTGKGLAWIQRKWFPSKEGAA